MRLLAQFVGVVLLVGFVGAYFWWIVAALAAVALVYFARRWWLAHRRRVAEREAEHAAIAARADQQHAWVLARDDRGVYGGGSADENAAFIAEHLEAAGDGHWPR